MKTRTVRPSDAIGIIVLIAAFLFAAVPVSIQMSVYDEVACQELTGPLKTSVGYVCVRVNKTERVVSYTAKPGWKIEPLDEIDLPREIAVHDLVRYIALHVQVEPDLAILADNSTPHGDRRDDLVQRILGARRILQSNVAEERIIMVRHEY